MNTTLHQNRPEDTQNWTNLYLEPHDYQIHYVNIDLRDQYGISVTESQTFLLTKCPQRRRARRNGCFRRLRHCLCPANDKTFVSYEKNKMAALSLYLNSVLNFISTFVLNTLPLNYSKVLFSGTFFSLFHFYLSLLLHRELTCHNSCKLCKIPQNYINL